MTQPWHIISEATLLAALRRRENGEPADLVYTEMYANADRQTIEGND